jgi:sugar phosphate isomerase/epimerase
MRLLLFFALFALCALGAAQSLPFHASVQAYTFNRFTAFEAIEKTASAGATAIELYPGQRLKADSEVRVGQGMGAEATAELKAHLERHGVRAVAFGVTGISRDLNQARELFTWAKSIGVGIINTESTDAMDTIEAMVREFDMKVGFHNHPRTNDPNYKVWDPQYVLDLVKDRDIRIGACADTGHWIRSGIKPMDALVILRGRVVSAHLKDLNEFSRDGHDVPWGQGVTDIPAVLRELMSQGFTGSLSVEYEHNWTTSLPEVAQCIGFVRGFIAGMRG